MSERDTPEPTPTPDVQRLAREAAEEIMRRHNEVWFPTDLEAAASIIARHFERVVRERDRQWFEAMHPGNYGTSSFGREFCTPEKYAEYAKASRKLERDNAHYIERLRHGLDAAIERSRHLEDCLRVLRSVAGCGPPSRLFGSADSESLRVERAILALRDEVVAALKRAEDAERALREREGDRA